MARVGKIARLPKAVREELNRRMEDGAMGDKLVKWLNALPKVRAVLKSEFQGQPITRVNLTNWKQGGYREWLDDQEDLGFARSIKEKAEGLREAADGALADEIAVWMSTQLTRLVKKLMKSGKTSRANWRQLHALCTDLAAFRRGDLYAQWVKQDKQRLEEIQCARFLVWFKDERARRIVESSGSRAAKITALRKMFFASADALEKSGRVKLPQ